VVLASESRHKGSNTLSIKSLVVNEARLRPGLGLVHCLPFSALTLVIGWREGHPACKKPISLIPKGSLLEQMEDPRGNRLTQVYLEQELSSNWDGRPFGHSKHKQKWGLLCPFSWRGAGFPYNTVSPEPRPTSIPSGILIRSAIWPQYTNITDGTDKTMVS